MSGPWQRRGARVTVVSYAEIQAEPGQPFDPEYWCDKDEAEGWPRLRRAQQLAGGGPVSAVTGSVVFREGVAQ